MYLQGQGGERGYAMAALLVSLGVMSVLMSVALPVWRHDAQREREAELIFRGEQYVRAIALYQRRHNSFPPSIDVLVQQRFLRKKYEDPMTEAGEFQPLFVGANIPQPGRPQGQGGGQGEPPGGGQPPGPGGGFTAPMPGASQTATGGIIGVVSKSKEKSIREYRGATTYDTWRFIFANIGAQPGGPGGQPAPGVPAGAQPMPGRPSGPGQGIGPMGPRGQPGSRPGPTYPRQPTRPPG